MDDESGGFMERAEVTGIGRSESEIERLRFLNLSERGRELIPEMK